MFDGVCPRRADTSTDANALISLLVFEQGLEIQERGEDVAAHTHTRFSIDANERKVPSPGSRTIGSRAESCLCAFATNTFGGGRQDMCSSCGTSREKLRRNLHAALPAH